jgi:predicted dehydrogenase
MGRIRVGMVGAGGVSKLHLEGISRHPEEARVVAYCDPDESSIRARMQEYGECDAYGDLADMLQKAEIHVAIVCTPTSVREAVILPLIEAGMPTLCEKPFCDNYPEASRITKASAELGVPVAVDQNFRRNFPFHIGRDILAGGQLGRPLHLVQNEQGLRTDVGWRLEQKRYVMSIMSIHWIDGYRWMLQDEAETVYCRAINSPATAGGEDTAISMVIAFRGGTIVSLNESFSSFARGRGCTLDCEKGALQLDPSSVTVYRPDADPVVHENPYDRAEGCFVLLKDLYQAAQEGREPETSVSDNIENIRILEAAYTSWKENPVVRVQEIR